MPIFSHIFLNQKVEKSIQKIELTTWSVNFFQNFSFLQKIDISLQRQEMQAFHTVFDKKKFFSLRVERDREISPKFFRCFLESFSLYKEEELSR